eukprot:scaffold123056_cov19-Tisochrysis_lutea.AAC.1
MGAAACLHRPLSFVQTAIQTLTNRAEVCTMDMHEIWPTVSCVQGLLSSLPGWGQAPSVQGMVAGAHGTDKVSSVNSSSSSASSSSGIEDSLASTLHGYSEPVQGPAPETAAKNHKS